MCYVVCGLDEAVVQPPSVLCVCVAAGGGGGSICAVVSRVDAPGGVVEARRSGGGASCRVVPQRVICMRGDGTSVLFQFLSK